MEYPRTRYGLQAEAWSYDTDYVIEIIVAIINSSLKFHKLFFVNKVTNV